ncbi:MAG: ECF transporter S component, partial [Acidobacteria bacterium]|nr:ECF transporter S component [Acidobacteriota bacterium]
MKKSSGYDLLLAGLFMALALVLPLLFHAIGLGSAFLPMFFPIIAAGFLVTLPAALVVGVMSPLVSAL